MIIYLGIAVVVVVLVVGLLVALVAYQKRQNQRRVETLAVVADRLGGTVVNPSVWSRPKIQFEHRGHRASLEFYSTGGKNPTYYTHLLFWYSRPAFELHIYPERWLSRVGKWLGGQDIQIADPQFDDKFMIKGSDPVRVQGLLTPEVRQAIFELRAIMMNDHIDLSTQKTAFRIRKLGWLGAADLLTSFASLGMQVFDQYLTAAGLASFGETAKPRCGVCDDEIGGSTRTCPRCHTPHHPECWELNDGCGKCRS